MARGKELSFNPSLEQEGLEGQRREEMHSSRARVFNCSRLRDEAVISLDLNKGEKRWIHDRATKNSATVTSKPAAVLRSLLKCIQSK